VETKSGYMTQLFISIGQMPFLAPMLDNADPLFALVITPGFYLRRGCGLGPSIYSGSLEADI